MKRKLTSRRTLRKNFRGVESTEKDVKKEVSQRMCAGLQKTDSFEDLEYFNVPLNKSFKSSSLRAVGMKGRSKFFAICVFKKFWAGSDLTKCSQNYLQVFASATI